MNFNGEVRVWYIAVTVLLCFILLVSFNNPTFQLFELWSKNRSFEVTHSISERQTGFWEKSIFLKSL